MITQDEQLQIIYSMDRDLLFFSTDEHTHLGILDDKNQRQLGKLIKKVLQQIQQIRKYDQQNATMSNSDNRHSPTYQQKPTIIDDFFQQKYTRQLYRKLKDIKNQYHDLMQQQEIRILASDLERYQQLQKIHSLSSRLDVYDQVYDELHHLRRALSSIRRNWKLERIQHIVNNIVASPSSTSSSSSSSVLSSTPIPLSDPCKISDHHQKHRTFFEFLKYWSKSSISSTAAATSTTSAISAASGKKPNNNLTNHHQHSHLLCTNEEQGRQIIMQIIRDFQQVFEENVTQNEQRMYQLYPRVFQQNVDPMLAHDIQHLYLSTRATSPPSLTSLTPSGISAVCSWTSDTTHELFFNSHHQSPIDFNDMIHYRGNTQQQKLRSTSPLSIKPISSSSSSSRPRKNRINWMNNFWRKRKQQQQHQQQPNYPTTLCQHYYFQQLHSSDDNHSDRSISRQEKMWSVCVGLLSEHLLYVGQQYYTQWMQEISQCQDKQVPPFQLATETMTATYRALQIEHGYSILSRICHQLESIGF